MDNENVKGVDEVLRKLQEAKMYLANDVQHVVGVEAVNHFKANFVNEGFDNDKWAPRRSKVKLNKKTLTGQGSGDHLGDSIDYRVEGNITIVYSDKLYAEIHNEGGEISVTPKMRKYFWAKSIEAKQAGDPEMQEQFKFMALSKTIKIKQRKFMGESDALNDKIIAKIQRDLSRILN